LAINKLFRILIPDLPILDKVGDLCQLVLEKDPAPIIKCLGSVLPDH